MGKNKKSYAKILPIITITFTLIVGIFGALIINYQIGSTADRQEKYLGDALSLQLAKVAKTSIINQDILSLQIEVDEVLAIEGLKYVAVYDASSQILAKAKKVSQKNSVDNLGSKYTSPITIETEIVGYALIQFDNKFFEAYFKVLNITICLLFVSIFSLLIYTSIKLGKDFSLRLNRIIQQLPSDGEGPMDELSMLEKRLEPLISARVKNQQPYIEEKYEESTILAINCKNLTILKTRVNPEHLESLMSQFDTLINDTAAIYGAVRLKAGQRCVYLKFKGKSGEDAHPLRALCCSSVIHKLSQKLLDAQGIKLELASAILSVEYKNFSSQLLQESSCEEHLNSLQLMLDQAVDDEILLDGQTKEHDSLKEVLLSPPSSKSLLFRVEGLGDICEKLTRQQIEILARDI